MSPSLEKSVEQAAQRLRELLGTNLYSCCLYGSAVRGNFVENQSDLNLLIVINESNPGAHEAIGKAIGNDALIDPFIVGKQALPRSARAFASKFASIQRNYRVIYGADALAELKIDPSQERFLCEQALRNLQLRMTYAFVTRERTKSYRRFLLRMVTPLFIQLSEVLRLDGRTVPKDFQARIPLFVGHFQISAVVLSRLLALRTSSEPQPNESDEWWHAQLFPLVDAVLRSMEINWSDK